VNELINKETTGFKLVNFSVQVEISMPFADDYQYFYWTEPWS
jgi:hypothetical protein